MGWLKLSSVSWLAALILLLGPVTAAERPSNRREPLTRELLEKVVSTDGALERYVHPELGLLLVDYIEGDYRRVEHLCGEDLPARMPDVRRALARDSNHWDTSEALSCNARTLECHYDPGEVGGHEGQYLFRRRPDGALALYAIVHLESGALDRRKHARFAAAALRTHKHARCPSPDAKTSPPPAGGKR